MDEKEAKTKLEKLSKSIRYHDQMYYDLDKPEIDDAEYDKLRELNSHLERLFPHLVRDDSPSKRVGIVPASHFQTFKHKVPMLSLNNAFNMSEVEKFYYKLVDVIGESNSIEIMAETKVDGLSAALHYENRRLKLVITRGDGKVGEDITSNARYIKDIKEELPNDFPSTLEVRGEIYMSNNIFNEINLKRKKQGLQEFSNPRNAAAGSVRQIDSSSVADRKLSFFYYSVINPKPKFVQSISEARDKLSRSGFKINKPYKLCLN